MQRKLFAAYRIGRTPEGKHMTVAGAGERGQRGREDLPSRDQLLG
jgi:hypothetical protein